MKASIQNLIHEFGAVVSEKDELEFRNMSELKSLFPLLASQDSNADVDIIFRDTEKRAVCFRYKANEIDTLIDKNELGRVEEIKV